MIKRLTIADRFNDAFFIALINRYFFGMGAIAKYEGYTFESVVHDFLSILYLEEDDTAFHTDDKGDNDIARYLCSVRTKERKGPRKHSFDSTLLAAQFETKFTDYFIDAPALFHIQNKRIKVIQEDILSLAIPTYRGTLLPLLEREDITKEEKLYINFITFDNFKMLINDLPRQQTFFSHYYCKYLEKQEVI